MEAPSTVRRIGSSGIFVGLVTAVVSAAVLGIAVVGRVGLWAHRFLLAFGVLTLLVSCVLIGAGALIRSGRRWAIIAAGAGLIMLALLLAFPMTIIIWASRLW